MNVPTIVESWKRSPVFLASVLGGFALLLVGVFGNDRPGTDVAICYAPQVREFAVGNWAAAFFHVTPPLVIVLAGVLAMLVGGSAFAALKVVSAALFLAGLWPLRRLLARVLPERYVAWGCVLYVISPRLSRYALAGTLESAKLFFLLWGLVLLFACVEKRSWRYVVGLALALAGLALSRAEGIFMVPFFAAGLVLLPAWTTRHAATGWQRPALTGLGQAAVVLALLFLLCLPQLLYVYRITGTPALDSRQTMRIRSLLKSPLSLSFPTPVSAPAALPVPAAPTAPSEAVTPAVAPPPPPAVVMRPVPAEDRVTPVRNVREAFKGLDMFWVALAAVGIVLRLRRRAWSLTDTALLALILYNVALFAANGFITKRYTATTAPFILAWAVDGVVLLRSRYLDRVHRRAFAAVITAVVLISAWNGLVKVRKWAGAAPNPAREFGEWVQQNRAQLVTSSTVQLISDRVTMDYHNGRRPIIAATSPQYAYWAAGDLILIEGDRIYPLPQVQARLAASVAELVVVDEEFREACPDFRGNLPGFAALPDQPGISGVTVFRRTLATSDAAVGQP